MNTLPPTELSVKTFLAHLGSEQPTPGGGAAAALVGAMAASLGRMNCALTIGKPKFASVEETLRPLATRLTRAAAMLQQLIDEDAAAYGELAEAFKLPRADPARAGRIASAAAPATAAPLATLAISRQVLHDVRSVAAIGNPNLKADMVSAEHLALAAMSAAEANVRANLGLLADSERVRIEAELMRLTA